MRERDNPNVSEPEQPRVAPEILPPAAREDISQTPGHSWIRIDGGETTYRAYFRRPGPFSIILALMVVGFIAAVILLLLVGVVLVWIPILIVLIAAAFVSGWLRNLWARPRGK